MSLHPCKTKFTVFHSNEQSIPWNELNILIDDNDENCISPDHCLIKKLTFVNKHSDTPAIRLLGVYFDPSLSFKCYMEQLNVKLSRVLFKKS